MDCLSTVAFGHLHVLAVVPTVYTHVLEVWIFRFETVSHDENISKDSIASIFGIRLSDHTPEQDIRFEAPLCQ